MPLIRFPTPTGLVYTIDLSKIADRANPRTVEAPISGEIQEPTVIDWGDGSSEVVTNGTFPEHTYADGAGDVFTITIRSATGHLPFCYWAKETTNTDTPAGAFTFGTISIDHFAGWLGAQTARSYGSGIRNTRNLKYCDPRLPGLSRWTNLGNLLSGSGIEQSAGSICLDFVTQNTTFQNAFRACASLTPPPYIFWTASGEVDTARFPSLAGWANCYAECAETLRAQVPTAYGGTMTVS